MVNYNNVEKAELVKYTLMHTYNEESNVLHISNEANNIVVKTVISINKKTISVTKVNSKIYKPRTYKKVMNNSIHSRRWKKAIEEKIQNFENHHIWEYDNLPPDQKTIGSK